MTNEELKVYEKQLKPCPFCGGKATFHECLGMGAFEVFCSNENCQVTPITDYYTNPEEAIKDWNRRSAESKVLEDIRAEIEDMVLDCSPQWHDPWWNGKKYGLGEVLKIIDKHISGEGDKEC